MPGWQSFFHDLKDKNFIIVSVAEDTGGVKDAGQWIAAAKPEYTALIDDKHRHPPLHHGQRSHRVWIDERGRIVRPNEVAYVDNRYKAMHGIDAAPYLDAIRDWVANGARSPYV